MSRYRGKLFGAALGFSFGGPIGAIIGAAVGHFIDKNQKEGGVWYSGGSERELHFITSLILLLSGTARADGVVTLQEVDAIRAFFRSQLGYRGPELKFIERIIHESFQKQINLQDTCASISQRTSYEERLFLLHLNYQVAVSDGWLSPPEEEYIRHASMNLGIQEYDYLVIRNSFSAYKTTSGTPGGILRPPVDPYTVLGISRDCSEEEIHKAYRNLASKYHPDRVAHLGKEFIDLANRRFMEIAHAYEAIKAERGLDRGSRST
jgi:DnaJ like chaperone protein